MSLIRLELGRTCYECHIELVGANLHNPFAGNAFGGFDLDARMLLPVSLKHVAEEAAGDQGVDAAA